MGNSRERGHSLLEMILAALVFASISVGVLSIWTMQHRSVMKSGHVMVAQYLGESLMETCIAARYDGLPSFDPVGGGPTPVAAPFVLRELEKDQSRDIEYRAEVEVEDISVVPAIPNDNTRLVVVRVFWDGKDGKSSIEYRTHIQEKG